MRSIDRTLVKLAMRNVEHALEEMKKGGIVAEFRASLDLLDAVQYLKTSLIE
jgi:hypothetical protein